MIDWHINPLSHHGSVHLTLILSKLQKGPKLKVWFFNSEQSTESKSLRFNSSTTSSTVNKWILLALIICNTFIHNWFAFRLHFYHKVHYFSKNSKLWTILAHVVIPKTRAFRSKILIFSRRQGRPLHRFSLNLFTGIVYLVEERPIFLSHCHPNNLKVFVLLSYWQMTRDMYYSPRKMSAINLYWC